MKPSELPKDDNFSGRINKKVKAALKELGMTPQKIVDLYANEVLKAEITVERKHQPRRKK